MNPKVSVITFVNVTESNGRYELLEETLRSVASQNFDSYEHIIVDDGSSKSIETLVESFPNTRFIYKNGSGILTSTTTFNLGHIEAIGEYCIYLASDDLQLDNSLSVLSSALDKNSDWVAVCGCAYYEYPDQTVEWSPDFHDMEERLIEVGNFVSGCAMMWRRNLFDDKQLLPPDIVGYCSDYDLWVRISEMGEVGTIPEKVVRYRSKPDSTRHKTKKKKFLSHKKFDLDRFQFSKNSRLRFVKNSATKRRLSTRQLGNKTCFSYDETDTGAAENLRAAHFPQLDSLVFKYNSAFFEALKEFETADLLGEENRERLAESWRNLCEIKNEDASPVFPADFNEVTCYGISAAAVWNTWLVEPEKYIRLVIEEFRENLFFYDYINWAYVDEIASPDLEIAGKLCEYIGLGSRVKISAI